MELIHSKIHLKSQIQSFENVIKQRLSKVKAKKKKVEKTVDAKRHTKNADLNDDELSKKAQEKAVDNREIGSQARVCQLTKLSLMTVFDTSIARVLLKVDNPILSIGRSY